MNLTLFLVALCMLAPVNGSQDARENFKFAKFHYDKGEFNESLTYIDKSLSQDSLYLGAYYLRAETYYALGNYYSAISDINRILALEKLSAEPNPDASKYLLTRAKSYTSLNDFVLASSDFEKVFEISKSNAPAYFERARFYVNTRNFDNALSDINQAVKLNSGKADYFSLRAQIRLAYGNPEPGSERYRAVLNDMTSSVQLEPKNHQFLMQRSEFLSAMGENEQAIKDYDQVISISPKTAEAYSNRGVLKMNNMEYSSAAFDLTRSILLNPDNEKNYRLRGLCYTNMNNMRDAVQDFSKSITMLSGLMDSETAASSLRSTLAETYILRGHCLSQMGNESLACRDFLEAYNLGAKKGLNYYKKYCGIY
ncbi:MAG: tetratricopeptide repeat protein [Cyclobacteriaceae bacterium]|nr:tetratricopeptide repeat protein [Cyclobacteriaceae bacterium]